MRPLVSVSTQARRSRAGGTSFTEREPARLAELTSFTRDERDIVLLAAFGHTYKFVAYETGITVSNLVRRLQSAMLKLGIASRRDLLRKLGRQAFCAVRFSARNPP